MKMYNDFLLVEADDDSKTSGGLYVPQNAKKRTKSGVVIASPSKFDDKEIPQKGEWILYDALGALDPIEVIEDGERRNYELVMLRQVILSEKGSK